MNGSSWTFWTSAARPGLGALLLAAAAGAAPAAEPGLRAYLVKPGDSLYSIAERELQDAQDWPLLARINRVRDPLRLQPGSTLLLPLAQLRGTPQPVVVAYARGEVRAVGADGAARPVRTGDLLQEGETLRLGAASFASLRLHDGSQVHVQEGSELRLQRQQRLPGGGQRSVLRLERGRVDSAVQPQAPDSGFEVLTPLAAAGVRGTRFGVALPGPGRGMVSDVVEGGIAFGPERGSRTAVAAGQGAVLASARAGVEVLPLLPAPVLQAPQLVERLPLTLQALGVDGAQAYRVQIARDAQFMEMLHGASSPDGRLSIDALEDGEYFVAARASDRHGLLGAEAQARLRVRTRPAPPGLQAPAADALLPLGPVELSCAGQAPAAAYLVQVSRQADFGRIEAEASGLPACRWRFEAAQPGLYHWRAAAMARNAAGELERGPFGEAARFEADVAPAVPRPQVMQTPGVQVHWAAQPGMRFVVELAADAGFRQVVQRLETARPYTRIELPDCRPYHLRLHALGPRGLRSPDSVPQRLRSAEEACIAQDAPTAAPAEAGPQRGAAH